MWDAVRIAFTAFSTMILIVVGVQYFRLCRRYDELRDNAVSLTTAWHLEQEVRRDLQQQVDESVLFHRRHHAYCSTCVPPEPLEPIPSPKPITPEDLDRAKRALLRLAKDLE